MNLWEQSKLQAKLEGKAEDWPYILQLYKQKGGMDKLVSLFIDKTKYELVGKGDSGYPIAKSDSGNYVELSDEEYEKSRKVFKSIPGKKDYSKLIPVKKLITKKDGTTYMGTVYVSPEEAKELQHQQEKLEDSKEKKSKSEQKDDSYWRNKTAELQADIATMWQLQCKNLYQSSNLGALAVRESVQNSRDAILQAIKQGKINRGKIDISWEGNSLTMEDNGVGMDVETLHTKFLNLGGTTKGGGAGDGSSVGGFGVAKAVILGSGETFEIHTRNNYLNSVNLGKGTIEETQPFDGTKITVHNVEVGKDHGADGKSYKIQDRERDFEDTLKDYLETSEVENIDILIQGKPVKRRFEKTPKTSRSLAEFGVASDSLPKGTDIEVNVFPKPEGDSSSGYIYVRLGGLTQFKQYLGWGVDSDVVVDFSTSVDPRSEDYPFSSSRESLKSKYTGILRAIDDTMSQNPIAMTDRDKYKETIFDNKTLKAEQERKVSKEIINTDMMDTMNVLHSLMTSKKESKGMEAQGEYKAPSLLDRIIQQTSYIKKEADSRGISAEEFLDDTSPVSKEDSSQVEDNPLEHAWLVWENKNRPDDFDISQHIDTLVTWDSILRKVAESSTRDVPEFYPGFILEENTLGMSVKKSVETKNGTEQRNFIMINPETIPTDDDFTLALYLREVACHELAHAMCESFESHGETYAYTREMLANQSIKQVQDIVNIVKESKIRNKLDKIKKDAEKQAKKKKQEELMKELLRPIEQIDKDFEALPNKNVIRDRLYWLIRKYETRGGLQPPERDDKVVVLSKKYPRDFGEMLTVLGYDEKKDMVTVYSPYSDKEYKLKSSQVISNKIIEDISEDIDDYFMRTDELYTWKRDNGEYGVAVLVSKYLPSYNMRKFGDMSSKQRVKSLDTVLEDYSHRMLDSYISEKDLKTKSYAELTEEYSSRVNSWIHSEFDSIMRLSDKEYYDKSFYDYSLYQQSHDELLKMAPKILDNYLKNKGKVKQSNTKKKKSKKEVSPQEKELSTKLRDMSSKEIFDYADELGITGLDKYDHEGIKRMRATMAIKKKLLNKSEKSYIIRG